MTVMTTICLCLVHDGRIACKLDPWPPIYLVIRLYRLIDSCVYSCKWNGVLGVGMDFGRSKPRQIGTPARRTGWYARIVPTQKRWPAWIFWLARGLHGSPGTADFPAERNCEGDGMRKKFWLVYVNGTASTSHKHETEHLATVECVRLAQMPGNKDVFLLQATHCYSVEDQPVRCELLAY